MPTDTREFLDRTQPDIALAVPRRVDIDLPLGRIAEPDRVASRRGFAPTLSQVAAYPLRWREGAHPRAVGQVDAA